MGGLTSIFAIIVIGFTFLSVTHVTRFWLIRQSGYMLFFATVTAGYIVAACTLVIAESLWLMFEEAEHLNFDIFENANITNLTTAGSVSILLGLFVNLMVNRDRAAKWVSFLNGDLIEALLQVAMDETKTIELALSNGKSYIGYPIESGITTFHESDIAVLLTLSGYRDIETKELKITTVYSEFISEVLSGSSEVAPEEFVVVLPKEHIISAKYFDINIFADFMENRLNQQS